MTWRLASSLLTLRAQLDVIAPNRSKASDGSVGDAAHFATGAASDHNPWCDGNVVTAIDITHDPAHGCDVWAIAQSLAASRDDRLKYLIYTGGVGGAPGILSATVSPWTWRPRSSDDHPHHLHISVNTGCGQYDSTAPWTLTKAAPKAPRPAPRVPAYPGLSRPSSRVSGATRAYQARLSARGWSVTVDGVHGPATTKILKAFQREKGLKPVDGIGGPKTWIALFTTTR